MFEHRLGLALGMTVAEVRAMTFEEYTSWRYFYVLEPWGWHDREYRTSALLTMLNNVNAKKSNRKEIKAFIRDMPKLVEQEVMRSRKEVELRDRFKKASKEERMQMIAKSFGGK